MHTYYYAANGIITVWLTVGYRNTNWPLLFNKLFIGTFLRYGGEVSVTGPPNVQFQKVGPMFGPILGPIF